MSRALLSARLCAHGVLWACSSVLARIAVRCRECAIDGATCTRARHADDGHRNSYPPRYQAS
eukprot:2715030-Prymnesium_polylepis.1